MFNFEIGSTRSTGPIIKWGAEGRSVLFDPFKRTRNIPFAISGRRRSISVFPLIPEDNTNKNDANPSDATDATNDDKIN